MPARKRRQRLAGLRVRVHPLHRPGRPKPDIAARRRHAGRSAATYTASWFWMSAPAKAASAACSPSAAPAPSRSTSSGPWSRRPDHRSVWPKRRRQIPSHFALPIASSTVDTVVSYIVWVDVPDFRTAIAEAARVLKPGGHLVAANLSFITASHGLGSVRPTAAASSGPSTSTSTSDRSPSIGAATKLSTGTAPSAPTCRPTSRPTSSSAASSNPVPPDDSLRHNPRFEDWYRIPRIHRHALAKALTPPLPHAVPVGRPLVGAHFHPPPPASSRYGRPLWTPASSLTVPRTKHLTRSHAQPKYHAPANGEGGSRWQDVDWLRCAVY